MAIVKQLKSLTNVGAVLYSKIIESLGRMMYKREYKGFPPAQGEKDWKEKWKPLQKSPSVNCYRKYAAVVDHPLDIIPMDMMNTKIQPVLNPNRFRPYYTDKNTFVQLYGEENVPVTVAGRIDGSYYRGKYETTGTEKPELEIGSDVDALIAKPSRDTYGGRGIILFKRDRDGKFRWNENPEEELSVELLDRLFGDNWILQHKMRQHSFMARFNPTSVNTIRVHVYRSPVTGNTDVAALCLRVGGKGKWFDNIHGGGFCVGVNLATGKVGHLCADGKGNPTQNTCDIDLEHEEIYIPDFKRLKEFAIRMGEKVLHHHSLAEDIMIDEHGNFKLIEINFGPFDANMYMATGSTPFGIYTDEVLNYCASRKKNISFVHVIPW